jgi:endonuclease YncB( thermonuclease family)
MTLKLFYRCFERPLILCLSVNILSSCVAGSGAASASDLALSEKEVPAKVFYCNDGDTCHIGLSQGSVWFNVRLFGVDAPETGKKRSAKAGQPLGEEAKDFLNSLVKGKDVTVIQADLDQYNRPVVEIYFERKNVNLMLVEKGLAEMYRGKSKRLDRSKFEAAEAKAKADKIGIWGLKNYESPSLFRKSQR